MTWAFAAGTMHVIKRMRVDVRRGGDDGSSFPPTQSDDPLPPPPLRLDELPPFPPDFLWGAATAAIQVEGCIDNTDWSLFTNSRAIRDRVKAISAAVGRPALLESPGVAVHHRDLKVLASDLDRAVLLGLTAYRFSIEWARIMPAKGVGPDKDALRYYSAAVDLMRARNLEPIVTLNHVSLPDWILTPPQASGPFGVGVDLSIPGVPDFAVEDEPFRNARGWEDPDTIDAFIVFVNNVVPTLQDRVKFWITLNEPTSAAAIGYIGGVWPPGFTMEGDRALRAYFHLLKAHSLAFRAIKSLYGSSESSVGVAMAIVHFAVSADATPRAIQDGAGLGRKVGRVIGGIEPAQKRPHHRANERRAKERSDRCRRRGDRHGRRHRNNRDQRANVVEIICLIPGSLVRSVMQLAQRGPSRADCGADDHFLDSLTRGTVDKAIRHETSAQDPQDAAVFFGMGDTPFERQLDFIGVNYYRNASVHYEGFLDLRAPSTGGAAFSNDLRNTRSPIAEERAREDHNLLNDLGWDMFPEGLGIMLKSISSATTGFACRALTSSGPRWVLAR